MLWTLLILVKSNIHGLMLFFFTKQYCCSPIPLTCSGQCQIDGLIVESKLLTVNKLQYILQRIYVCVCVCGLIQGKMQFLYSVHNRFLFKSGNSCCYIIHLGNFSVKIIYMPDQKLMTICLFVWLIVCSAKQRNVPVGSSEINVLLAFMC